MRRRLAVCAALLAIAAPTPRAAGQDIEAAHAALLAGEYDDAIDSYRRVLRESPDLSRARIDLMEALVSTGQHEEAVEVGRSAPSAEPVANALGEALLHLGRLDEAEAAFRLGAGSDGPWALTAEANLGELEFSRGRIDEAMNRFDRFIDVYNDASGRLSARDLVAVGRAVRYLGRRDPALFQDALKAFDRAIEADGAWPEAHVRLGDLFLEKYDSRSAKVEYDQVLEANPRNPRALLGLARALVFDGASDAENVIGRLIEVDPDNVDAHAIMASRYLTNERFDEARAEAEAGLAVNPNSLVALTALAGVHLLADDDASFREVRERALAINPRYAELDVELAELSAQTRRYDRAVERAQAAVALDSAAWEGWGLLGMNQLRLGLVAEGRASLDRAFEGDPYNPWFKNNLDLLDTFDRFEVHETEHFQLFLHGTEDELLATYLEPLAEEAYDSLSRRYGVEPDLPVRAELFPSHADFSVRTLGEVGLGALGVSFGRVLVMDSPSARELGDYNWASVFWHELSHTFHLAASENRVPRWFSEGLAVHEQRRARSRWGHQPSISFLQALRDGRLKPVSELNDGFMHPEYPEQVIFSYYQASLVFEYIENRQGFGAIRDMLEGYRRGETTESLFTSVLGTSATDFDGAFDDYIRERFRSPLQGLVEVASPPPMGADPAALRTFARQHPGDLITRMRLGITLFREGDLDGAEEELRVALRIFPDYGGPDSPLWFLAQIHRQRGELEEAASALAALNGLSESNYQALVAEADVLEELGREEESAAALDLAVQVWPYEIEVHQRLAELHTKIGNREGAVLERSAVVALAPADQAEALYQLALAQRNAGDTGAARRSVIAALEIAPNYEDALELLLAIRGSSE